MTSFEFGGNDAGDPCIAFVRNPVQAFLGALAAGDAHAAAHCFSEDGLFQEIGKPIIQGRTALQKRFERFTMHDATWEMSFRSCRTLLARKLYRLDYCYTIACKGSIEQKSEFTGSLLVRLHGQCIAEWREFCQMNSHQSISIDLKHNEEKNVEIFTLHGSLDVATSPSVRAALLDVSENQHRNLIIDLSHLEFIDSTGLGSLIASNKRATEIGGRVAIVARDGQILRLLRITGLLSVLETYSTLEDALSGAERLSGLTSSDSDSENFEEPALP